MNQEPGTPRSGEAGTAGRPPPMIADYEMLRRIGGGSYGEVWLARNVVLDTYHAVKVVFRAKFTDDRPFERELEGIRRFEQISRSHPNLVNILHVGRGEGFIFHVMELADDASESDGAVGGEPRGEEAATVHGGPDRPLTPVLSPQESQAVDPGPRTLRSEGEGAGKAGQGMGRDDPSVRAKESVSGTRRFNPETYIPSTVHRLVRGADHSGKGLGVASLSVGRCVEIGIALASALDFLHRQGLVHRDIKPSNVVFVKGQPKLADIGLVTLAGEGQTFVGTEGYVAREGPGHPQADLYALGKLLYELMAGLRAGDYPKLPDGWADAPDHDQRKELNQVVLRACEADLRRRYKSAEEMRSDLEFVKSRRSLLRLRKLERTQRRLLVALVAVMGMLGAVGFVVLVYKRQSAELDRQALVQAASRELVATPHLQWSTRARANLEEAAQRRLGWDIKENAVRLLAGLDATWTTLADQSVSSAAFASDGRCVLGGAGTNRAIELGVERCVAILPTQSGGPVGWAADGVPLQLTVRRDAVVLHEVRTGTVRREFRVAGLKTPAVLAMTTDGGEIAVALTDRVPVWDAELAQFLGEARQEASALAFSPNGALLAAGDAEGTTRLYSLPALQLVATLTPPAARGRITCLAFGRNPVVRADAAAPTNSWLLATGEQGGEIVIWDLNRRLPRSFCRGSTWTTGAIAFTPDGSTLASVGRNEPRLWDVSTGQVLLLLEELSTGLGRAVAFDAQGRTLVCGGEADGGIARVAWCELELSRGIQSLRGLSSAARKVWLSRDGNRLAALSDRWELAVWELAPERLLFVFDTPMGVYADSAGGCFDAQGVRFALAAGREACLYDLKTGGVLRRWELLDGRADQVEYDAQGRLLLLRRELLEETAESKHREWRLYELAESKKPIPLLKQGQTNLFAQQMLFQPGGARFAVWYGDGEGTNRTVHVYSVEDGREVWHETTEVSDGDLRMCVDPSGQWLGYTFDRSRRLRIVQFENSRLRYGVTDGPCEAIGPACLEFASTGQQPRLWWRRGGSRGEIPLTTGYGGLTWVSAFSADGRLFAWGTGKGVVCVADVAEVKRRLAGLGLAGPP